MNDINQTPKDKHILIVDDSVLIQNYTARLVRSIEGIKYISVASNGKEAVEKLTANPGIDLIVLDIEMPIMNGIEALPHLLEANPKVKIIISSTLSIRGGEVTIKALSLGACDYITKPSPSTFHLSVEEFERELTSKIIGLLSLEKDPIVKPIIKAPLLPLKKSPTSPEALVIGCSTGGPSALLKIFENLHSTKIPIFIVQHMPPIFTGLLAENIEKASGIKTIEVSKSELINNNTIYLAAGGLHLEVSAEKSIRTLEVNTNSPENFCRPSVNPLFSSAVRVYKDRLLGFVLTGIGSDGLNGAKDIVEHGGEVIAQDQSSSIVWGMPKAVSESGYATKVMSLDEIMQYIHRITK
jgi:two-component system, chemotaxis family, protein-glutamate methylesterase/glutaminase